MNPRMQKHFLITLSSRADMLAQLQGTPFQRGLWSTPGRLWRAGSCGHRWWLCSVPHCFHSGIFFQLYALLLGLVSVTNPTFILYVFKNMIKWIIFLIRSMKLKSVRGYETRIHWSQFFIGKTSQHYWFLKIDPLIVYLLWKQKHIWKDCIKCFPWLFFLKFPSKSMGFMKKNKHRFHWGSRDKN